MNRIFAGNYTSSLVYVVCVVIVSLIAFSSLVLQLEIAIFLSIIPVLLAACLGRKELTFALVLIFVLFGFLIHFLSGRIFTSLSLQMLFLHSLLLPAVGYFSFQHAELKFVSELSKKRVNNLHQSIYNLKKIALNAEKLKTSFLLNLSHEVRTPLNGITGFSELICKSDVPREKLVYYKEHILNSSQRLLNVIEDILFLSRLDTNQYTSEKVNFNINELLKALYYNFKENASKKNLKFILQEFPNDLSLIGDKLAIKLVMGYLLDNAIKFTSKGSIVFGYQIKRSDDDMPGIIKLFVKDTGIGIPEKFREDIFKSFFQVDNHTSRRYEGNGLGLTIANSLCKKMGVKLHLISEENKGSKFYFYLPCLNKAAIMDHGSFNTADMINFSDDLASASDFQGRPDASSPASG